MGLDSKLLTINLATQSLKPVPLTFPMGAGFGITCPCLTREKGELLPSNASGGDDGYGWCVAQNTRQSMEDAVDVDVRGPDQGRLFAVYDGHGGSEAVGYLKQELPKILNKEAEVEAETNFHQCYEKLDECLGGQP